MSLRFALIILFFLSAFAHAGTEYSLPLVGHYAVIRRETRAMCYLAEVENGHSSFGVHEILGHVEEIAVAGTLITGKANNQYFLLNTARPDAEPEMFATADQWNSALKTNGITTPIQFSTPDALAANLPDHVLRPWRFRVMKNLFGLSDYEWSGLIELAGLILSFVMGLLMLRRMVRIPLIIILVIIDFVADIALTGGGPSAFLGLFFLPLVFLLVAAFGSMIRKRITRWLSSPVDAIPA